jgi:hypothetical protein
LHAQASYHFVFLRYITITILNQILSAHQVTRDTIAGALCGYCLIGLTWAFVYRGIFAIIIVPGRSCLHQGAVPRFSNTKIRPCRN